MGTKIRMLATLAGGSALMLLVGVGTSHATPLPAQLDLFFLPAPQEIEVTNTTTGGFEMKGKFLNFDPLTEGFSAPGEACGGDGEADDDPTAGTAPVFVSVGQGPADAGCVFPSVATGSSGIVEFTFVPDGGSTHSAHFSGHPTFCAVQSGVCDKTKVNVDAHVVLVKEPSLNDCGEFLIDVKVTGMDLSGVDTTQPLLSLVSIGDASAGCFQVPGED